MAFTGYLPSPLRVCVTASGFQTTLSPDFHTFVNLLPTKGFSFAQVPTPGILGLWSTHSCKGLNSGFSFLLPTIDFHKVQNTRAFFVSFTGIRGFFVTQHGPVKILKFANWGHLSMLSFQHHESNVFQRHWLPWQNNYLETGRGRGEGSLKRPLWCDNYCSII